MKIRWMACIVFLLFSQNMIFPQGDSMEAVANKKYAPALNSLGIDLDYALFGQFQGAAVKVKLPVTDWLSLRATSRLAFSVLQQSGSDIKYDFSYIPSAEILLQSNTVFHNILRPYLVYDLNYIYGIQNQTSLLAYSLRSALEFYLTTTNSLYIEAGLQLPLARSSDANIPGGGIIVLGGAWYFD